MLVAGTIALACTALLGIQQAVAVALRQTPGGVTTLITLGRRRSGLGDRRAARRVRLPPALAASATPRILELLGQPPGRVLELGFAGIHASRSASPASRSSSWSPTLRIIDRARERARLGAGRGSGQPASTRSSRRTAPTWPGARNAFLLVARDGSVSERR